MISAGNCHVLTCMDWIGKPTRFEMFTESSLWNYGACAGCTLHNLIIQGKKSILNNIYWLTRNIKLLTGHTCSVRISSVTSLESFLLSFSRLICLVWPIFPTRMNSRISSSALLISRSSKLSQLNCSKFLQLQIAIWESNSSAFDLLSVSRYLSYRIARMLQIRFTAILMFVLALKGWHPFTACSWWSWKIRDRVPIYTGYFCSMYCAVSSVYHEQFSENNKNKSGPKHHGKFWISIRP